MSRKIAEYFKVTPKELKIDLKSTSKSAVEETISTEFEEFSKTRGCHVVLNYIKNQAGRKELKLFEEVTFDDSQNKRSKSKNHTCSICNQKIHVKFLDLHMRKKHPNGQAQQFECDFDGKIFKSKNLLYNHMKVHLSLVKCEICNKMLKMNSLKVHLKNFHATEQKFQCKICPKSFKSTHNLYNHEKTHNKAHECDICKRMFPFKNCLNKHKKENHENAKSFECEICNKKFNQKKHLKAHQKTHDKNRLRQFKCHRCKYASDKQTHYKDHQKFHDRQDEKFAAMKNPLKCNECSTFHRNKSFLKSHMKTVHPKVIFQCDLCARFIKIKSYLVKHLSKHIQKPSTTGINPF